MIKTLIGEMDESTLILHEGSFENDDLTMHSVEYCAPGCSGEAHLTGKPDGEGFFCRHHIHRSVVGNLKRGLGVEALTGKVG